MPSQKLVLDFEIIIILIELVLIQTPLSQKLVQISEFELAQVQ